MSLVICCPCGTPIDADHLDVVVSLSCPQCKRELSLEFEEGANQRRRALLTVVDGPHWIGERFLVPVDVDLQIGQNLNNWISLDDEEISPIHCRLKLQANGSLILEDRGSTSGTWVGQQRIARVRLAPKQSFRVGPFKLRLEHDAVNGAGVAPEEAEEDLSGLLPTMQRVGGRRTIFDRVVSRRYQIARGLMTVTALLIGASNVLGLHARPADPWRWPPALALGACMSLALFAVSRRVTLADRRLRFLSIGLLIILAIFDVAMGLRIPAATQAGMAMSLALLVVHPTPPPALVVTGGALGGIACGVLLVATIMTGVG